MPAYSRQRLTKSGCDSGSEKLRIFSPHQKLYLDLLVRQYGRRMGCSLFLTFGTWRNSWKLLSLERVALYYQLVPMVLPNSSSILSNFGLAYLQRSELRLSQIDGALLNSFCNSKEGKSKVFSRSQNSISQSPLKGDSDLKSGTESSKVIERPQCQRTAFSRQPGLTGGGNSALILKYFWHLTSTTFQNSADSCPNPKTRLRQSIAKSLNLSSPSTLRSLMQFISSLPSRNLLLCSSAALSIEMSASACWNSFLMVLASASTTIISRTQGRPILSWMRWRQRTLMPISCMMHLIEQLSTNSSQRSLSLSISNGIQQLSINLLAYFTFASQMRLASAGREERIKACVSSWQFQSLQQSRKKATSQGRSRARVSWPYFWQLQSIGKTIPGLIRQQKLGRMTWSCVLSFLKLYSKILSRGPSGASTFFLASTSQGSLLTLSTSSMTSSESLSLPISCRSPSCECRLQTSVFSSSLKGMSHITSSLTPLYSRSDMRGSLNLQPLISLRVKRMSLMLQLTMNSWLSSLPPVFSHRPWQQRKPSNYLLVWSKPHTSSSTQFLTIFLAMPLKYSISLSKHSSFSIFQLRCALKSVLITASQNLQYSRQKDEMPKDYSTDWFFEFIISASSFSFFLR